MNNFVNLKNILEIDMPIKANNEFYDLIKMAVAEAIREERVNLYFSLLPNVSDNEMQDIEKSFTSLDETTEYEDITDWFINESNNQ